MRPSLRLPAALVLPVLVAAQGVPPGVPKGLPRVVSLTVAATDSKGAPASGLTEADFQITDAGKPRSLSFVRPVPEPLALAVAPGQSTNRTTNSTRPVTVLLLDQLNAAVSERTANANHALRELSKVPGNGQVFAFILSSEGRLVPIRGLPGTVPGKSETGGDDAWTAQGAAMLEKGMRDSARIRTASLDMSMRIQWTLNALESLANQMAVFPGRKGLVWFSAGMPLSIAPQVTSTGATLDFTPQLLHLAHTFDRAATSVYPVRLGATGEEDSLEVVAQLTGGVPPGDRDIAPTLRQAISDARGSYQLAFLPPDDNWDGGFHKLRVASARKGVRVRTKAGYYAFPDAGEAEVTEALRAMLADPSDRAGICLRGEIVAGPKPRLSVRIGTADIALARQGARRSAQLRLVLSITMSDGRVVLSPVLRIEPEWGEEQAVAAVRDGIPFDQEIATAGIDKIRVAVYDRGSGVGGSLTLHEHAQR